MRDIVQATPWIINARVSRGGVIHRAFPIHGKPNWKTICGLSRPDADALTVTEDRLTCQSCISALGAAVVRG